jgi:2,3-dihydroxyphenylpropionate 1,2-dioxygenase
LARICGGFSVSHAPGIVSWPDAPREDERTAVFAAFDRLKAFVAEQRPDVIVAFLDDHFDNHYRGLMPSVSVAVADHHHGPGEQYFELLRADEKKAIHGAPDTAEALLAGLVAGGFDVARMGSAEFGNNLMVPLELIRPECDIPIIPVFINVFTPPLISMRRAADLGKAIREIAGGWSGSVMFVGTGGLSHWPPFWTPTREGDDEMLRRMRRYQTEGRHVLDEDPTLFTDVGPYEIRMAEEMGDAVVNSDWDRDFMDHLEAGRIDELTAMTYDDVEQRAGHGGHEVLNWMAVAGAMNESPCEVLVYAPTPEWICGTGAVLYRPES